MRNITDAAKRYRVDIEKLQEAVAAQFTVKRERSKAKEKAKLSRNRGDPSMAGRKAHSALFLSEWA